MSSPELRVIAASTREGRKGIAVARWFVRVAEAHGGFDVQLVDLAEVDLPLLDEPNNPQLAQYRRKHTQVWSATVSRADAYVFVTPEYNHSFPASLKNSLDFLNQEWAHKPAGLVSYGGVSGGLRAATAIKPVLTALRMVPATDSVSVTAFSGSWPTTASSSRKSGLRPCLSAGPGRHGAHHVGRAGQS